MIGNILSIYCKFVAIGKGSVVLKQGGGTTINSVLRVATAVKIKMVLDLHKN